MATVLPTVVMHDFVIKDDAVTIELSHTEMATREDEDLALYERLLALLWSVAVEGEQARALLASRPGCRLAALSDVRSAARNLVPEGGCGYQRVGCGGEH
jgi:hypothetical protein